MLALRFRPTSATRVATRRPARAAPVRSSAEPRPSIHPWPLVFSSPYRNPSTICIYKRSFSTLLDESFSRAPPKAPGPEPTPRADPPAPKKRRSPAKSVEPAAEPGEAKPKRTRKPKAPEPTTAPDTPKLTEEEEEKKELEAARRQENATDEEVALVDDAESDLPDETVGEDGKPLTPQQLYLDSRTPTFGFFDTNRRLTQQEVQRRRRKLQALIRPKPRPLLARERAQAVDIEQWTSRQLVWYLHRLVTGERHMESEYFFRRIPTERRTVWVYTTVMKSIARRGGSDKCEAIIQEMKARGLQPNVHTYMLLLDLYAKRPDEPNLDKTLATIYADSIKPDIHIYNILLGFYARVNNRAKAFEVLAKVESEGLKWDLVTYSTLIDMFAKFNEPDKSREILDKMKADNLKPGLEGYGTQIAECAAMGDEWKLEELFDQMQKASVKATKEMFDLAIEMYCLLREHAKAEKLLARMIQSDFKPDLQSFNYFLEMYTFLKKKVETERIWAQIEAGNVKPDLEAFNYIIKINCFATDTQRTLDLLHAMKSDKHKVEPSLETYQGVVDMFASLLDVAKVRSLIGEIAAQWPDKPVPIAIYNSLLQALCQLDLESEIDALVGTELAQAKITPDMATFKILLRYRKSTIDSIPYTVYPNQYATPAFLETKTRVPAEAEAIARHIAARPSFPNSPVIHTSNSAYAAAWADWAAKIDASLSAEIGIDKKIGEAAKEALANGDKELIRQARVEIEKMEDVFKQMKAAQVKPDMESYNLLLSALAKKGESDKVADLLSAIKRDDLKLDITAHETLIQMWATGLKDVHKTAEVVDAMRREMIRPGNDACCLLLELYSDYNEDNYMMSILGRLRSDNVPPYLSTFHHMINMYVRTGDTFGMEDMVKSMRATYVPLDVHAYTLVIDGYAQAKRLGDALNTIQHMVFEEDIRPLPATLVAILKACQSKDKLDEALRQWNDFVLRFGVIPDINCYGALLEVCGSTKNYEKAFKILESMPPQEVETYGFCAQVMRTVFIADSMVPAEMILPNFSTQPQTIPATPSTSTAIPPKPTAFTPVAPPTVPKLVYETPLQQYLVSRWLRRGLETPDHVLAESERAEWKKFVADMKIKFNKHR